MAEPIEMQFVMLSQMAPGYVCWYYMGCRWLYGKE